MTLIILLYVYCVLDEVEEFVGSDSEEFFLVCKCDGRSSESNLKKDVTIPLP
jgi:hypothetical protein